jgi:hypothetical protein
MAVIQPGITLETGNKPKDLDWRRSLSEFGQVKLTQVLDPQYIIAEHYC